jgi:uncharacterized OsmC-like protein
MKNTNARMINGVDVIRLKGTIDAVTENPAIADFNFKTTNKWMTGGHNRSTIQGFYGACQEDTTRNEPFVLDNDEPDVLLGQDNGANPVEYVLHALAGCITTSIVYHAAARGIKLQGVESSLEGYLDLQGFLGLNPSTPKGYQSIKIQYNIDGDLTWKQKEEIVSIGCQFSPVYEMMSKAVPDIQVNVE